MRRWLTIALLAVAVHASDTYVIVAGVEKYDDTSVSSLAYSVQDVKAFADEMRAAGVSEDDLIVLTSDQTAYDKRPTRANLLAALQRVAERAAADDTLIFYFSGHGMQKGDTPYLLTVDSQRRLLEDTALPMRLINTAMQGARLANVLFIIDACRNDPDAGKATSDARLDETFAKDIRLRALTSIGHEPNTAVLMACDVGQRAWEMPSEDHGAFTYYLLKGMASEARDPDGAVRLAGLTSYLRAELPKWCERAQRPAQTPRLDNPKGVNLTLIGPAPKAPDAAVIHVWSKPAGAKVYAKVIGEDEAKVVGRTPISFAGSSAAEVKVSVVAPEHQLATRVFRLAPGQQACWSVALRPAGNEASERGTVIVNSQPDDAAIEVGGRPFGRTPATLFLPSGVTSLTVRADDHEAISRRLTVVDGESQNLGALTLKPLNGRLSVVSDPAGATVLINGEAAAAKTPVLLSLPPGTVTMTLRLEGYVDVLKSVAIAPNQETAFGPVGLSRAEGHVRITSNPWGAKVYVNGQDTGQVTPCTLPLPDGESTVTLRLADFEEYVEKITVRANHEERPAPAELKPIPGTVKVTSSPAGAEVRLDGKPTGEKTPCSLAVPPGEHQLDLSATYFRTERRSLTAVANRPVTLAPVTLTRLQGSVQFSTQPSGAEVYVDGQRTSRETPCTIVLPAGEHKVEARLAGYASASKAIDVLGESAAVQTSVALTPTAAVVSVTSTPAGAAVWVDGVDQHQTTPCRLLLTPGQHAVALRHPDCRELTRTATFALGSTNLPLTLVASPPAIVHLESAPSGASVWVDGQELIGKKTPCTMEVKRGQRCSIRVALEGRLSSTQTVNVEAGKETKVVALLPPPLAGGKAVTEWFKGPASFRYQVEYTVTDVLAGSAKCHVHIREKTGLWVDAYDLEGVMRAARRGDDAIWRALLKYVRSNGGTYLNHSAVEFDGWIQLAGCSESRARLSTR